MVLTHRHRDHLGGVAHLRERFRGLRVGKMIHRDSDLPEGVEDLRDGATIEGDGVTLVPLHTPGHASDHLCYYLPEEKAVFTGDVVLSGSTTVIPAEDGDLLDYLNSLKRLQELGVRRIYPAHGPVIEDGPGAASRSTSSTGCCASGRSSRRWATACTRSRPWSRSIYARCRRTSTRWRRSRSPPTSRSWPARVACASTCRPDAPSRWELV